MMVPMANGIRLTSGAEFAHRDSPPTPRQIDMIEPRAREMLPLEAASRRAVDGRAPVHARHAAGDGKAPRHKGLWFNFGHAHHGSHSRLAGRLLSEMITGSALNADPKPTASSGSTNPQSALPVRQAAGEGQGFAS